jgi:phosphoglycolate phosphatase
VVRLAILDLDGTLIDSVDDLAASVNHALAALGLPLRSTAEVRGFIGEGARVLLTRAVGAHPEQVDRALDLWRDHYQAHLLDHTRPYPGVVEALAGARRTLAVLTNKPGPMARAILDGLGVGPRLARVVGGDEAPRKPDPAGVLRLVAELGGRPEDTLFIGDSRVDGETARNAGIPFVAVTWGLGARAELAALNPRAIVDRAEELAPWLA